MLNVLMVCPYPIHQNKINEMKQRIWITSDNHFSHKNIHRFCPETRPDVDWKIMDQKMIRQWQTQVQPNDLVYCLGDFFFCNAEEAISIIDRLPGQKHLIFGNHDGVIHSSSTLRGKFASTSLYKEVKFQDHKIVLFHYPIHEWYGIGRGAIHCHGHIHAALSGVPGRIMNVCVDSSEMASPSLPYALYPMEEMLRRALIKPVRGHHEKVDL